MQAMTAAPFSSKAEPPTGLQLPAWGTPYLYLFAAKVPFQHTVSCQSMDAATSLINAPAASRWRIGLALAGVYVVWGSTYFAIGEAVRTIPPFLMASTRFITAGLLLYTWRRAAGAARPLPVHWKSAAVIGLFLILGGNGFVSWAEQRVPSGLAALIISITPVVMVLVDWLRPRGSKPGPRVLAGLAIGLAGMAILVGPARLEAARDADAFSTFMCVLAPTLWAIGSIYSRQVSQAPDLLLAAALQMIVGSGWLLLAAVITGEFADFAPAAITAGSAIAWVYLTLIGALVGYSCYIYLLKHTTPAVASTYAYVNPVVAVLLGWGIGGEVVTPRILFAATLLIGSVVLITAFKGRR
jgi:drug/metabolite transporter (DMT)-like permease